MLNSATKPGSTRAELLEEHTKMTQISADIKSIERELSALSAAKTVVPRHVPPAESGSADRAKSRYNMPLAEEHLDSTSDANPSQGLRDVRKNLLSSYFDSTRAVFDEQQSGLSTEGGGMIQQEKLVGIQEFLSASASAAALPIIGESDSASILDCKVGIPESEVHARFAKFQDGIASETRSVSRPPSPTTMCDGEDDPIIIHEGNAEGGEEVDLAR